jgi:hypothetical protein
MKRLSENIHHLPVRLIAALVAAIGLCGALHAQTAKRRGTPPPPVTLTLLARPELGGSALGGGTHKAGAIVEVLAIPAPHYRFVRWEGQVAHSSLERTRTLVTANTTLITAVFEPVRYKLSITCEPAYTGRVEGAGWHPYGMNTPVRATPANGYRFSHWEGPVASPGSDDTTLSPPLTGPVKLKAHFKRAVDDCILTVNAEPALGGEVTGAGSYAPGTVARLTAKPAHGFVFNGWQGAVSSPGAAETEILITRDMGVKAMFISQKALIRATIVPEGAGRVSGDLGVRPCFVSASLRAEAMPGFVFDGWEGAVTSVSGDRASVTPSKAGEMIVVTARFKAAF